mmetsp:Transcript_40960/g.98067  ORF Transcript_40960/g.98067 Transcript_40960/m.98067 type:complete len:130 (+) Transcript_40960:908-1297(+)
MCLQRITIKVCQSIGISSTNLFLKQIRQKYESLPLSLSLSLCFRLTQYPIKQIHPTAIENQIKRPGVDLDKKLSFTFRKKSFTITPTTFPATSEIAPNRMMLIHARPATKDLPLVVSGLWLPYPTVVMT